MNNVVVGAWVYDAADQVITETVSNTPYRYDATGNLTSTVGSTFTYDALGRLTSGTTGGTTSTYSYNGDGTLVRQVTGGTTTNYTQDLQAGLSQVLAQSVGGSATRYTYGYDRLAGTTGGTRTWELHDPLGSVRLTANNSGLLQTALRYDPWGSPVSGTPAPFGFTGELVDGNTDLNYHRARWYNPALGVFQGRDPFMGVPEMPYSQHYYQYGYSNPAVNTDPTGKFVDHFSSIRESNRSFSLTDLIVNTVFPLLVCTEEIGAMQDESRRREDLLGYLKNHGINIIRNSPWLVGGSKALVFTEDELQLIKDAIEMWKFRTNWSESDFFMAFRDVSMVKSTPSGGTWLECPRSCYLNDLGQGLLIIRSDALPPHRNRIASIATIIHELAHRWDDKSGVVIEFSDNLVAHTHGREGKPHEGPEGKTTYYPGQPDMLPNQYAGKNRQEDFAESVTATLISLTSGGDFANPKFFDRCSMRKIFVKAALDQWPENDIDMPNTGCRISY